MKKTVILLACALILFIAPAAFCAESPQFPPDPGLFRAVSQSVVIGLGIVGGLCGIGMGIVVASALMGISRQPDAAGKIQSTMFIGAAFIESLVLYTLFICIILLFANPFIKYMAK